MGRPTAARAARDRDPADAGQVGAHGVEVVEVHGQRVVDLLADLEGRGGGDRLNLVALSRTLIYAWEASFFQSLPPHSQQIILALRLSVVQAAATHGYSRPAYYLVASSFAQLGTRGLLDERRGRRGPLKLSPEILAFIAAEEPGLSGAAVAESILRRFGISLHRRTIERARRR